MSDTGRSVNRDTPLIVPIVYNNSKNDTQWIRAVEDAAGTHDVFGRLHQITTSFTTRVNYTVTPNLSIQVYAQPFVSAGAYASYKELTRPLADRNADRYASFPHDGDADFNVLSVRTTNVMRWEYKPGSVLFVVWQQGREGFTQRGNYRFARDFGDQRPAGEAGVLVQSLNAKADSQQPAADSPKPRPMTARATTAAFGTACGGPLHWRQREKGRTALARSNRSSN